MAIAAEWLASAMHAQPEPILVSANTLLQNQFPYLETDLSFPVQPLPADTSRDCSLLFCQQFLLGCT